MAGNGATAVEYAIYFAVICTFVYNLIAHPAKVDGRIGSTLINPNSYSFLLMLGVLFALRRMLRNGLNTVLKHQGYHCVHPVFRSQHLWRRLPDWLEKRYAPYGSSQCICVVVLALAAADPASYVGLYGGSRSIRGSRLCAVPVASVLADHPLADYLGGRNVADTSILMRDQMLKDATNLWLQRPFTGWGLDQFRAVSGWGTYSHDNYVELLANGGLVGLMLYLMIYLATLGPWYGLFVSREILG